MSISGYLTLASAAVAIAASVVAFISAHYWRKASRVSTMPSGTEPGTAIGSQAWQLSGVQGGLWEAAPLNAAAAKYGAWAASLFGASGILAAAAAVAAIYLGASAT